MLSAISQQRDDSKNLDAKTFDSKEFRVAFMDILLSHKLAARNDHGDLEITERGGQFLEEYMSLSKILD
jgi:hypothetical protein